MDLSGVISQRRILHGKNFLCKKFLMEGFSTEGDGFSGVI